MNELVHIVYVSLSQSELSERDLEKLLIEIRAKNVKKRVTGMLLYHNGAFIQVIEGPKTIIESLIKKLKKDPRHHSVLVLLKESIDKRSFPNWSMGYEKINKEQAKNLKGFTDFMFAEDKSRFLENCTKDVIYLLNSFLPAKPIRFPNSKITW